MYKALNSWVFGGFGPNKTPYEFIDYAAAKGLDGVEMTIGDCLDIETDEATCRAIAAYAKEKGLTFDIEVDGGLKPDNIALATEAGANVIVAGSAIFLSPDPKRVIDEMRATADEHPYRA